MGHELPESFVSWVLGGIVAVVTTLAAVVTTLWRANEAKNAEAIKEQAKQIAGIEDELKVVKEHGNICEQSRIECEKDRARLGAKCEIFEKRLTELEKKI
jgi:septal ring factor EnvC (AmiA/AmiB activator)